MNGSYVWARTLFALALSAAANPTAGAGEADCPVVRIDVCAEESLPALAAASPHWHQRYRLASGVVLGVLVPPEEMRELTVATPRASGWRQQRLCNGILGGVGWDALAEVAGSKHVFAALQNESEGQGGDATIAHSADGGRSWRVRGCVAPPHWSGVVRALEMATRREGAITFELFDVGSEGPPAGLYRARTADGGRTWTTPIAMP